MKSDIRLKMELAKSEYLKANTTHQRLVRIRPPANSAKARELEIRRDLAYRRVKSARERLEELSMEEMKCCS